MLEQLTISGYNESKCVLIRLCKRDVNVHVGSERLRDHLLYILGKLYSGSLAENVESHLSMNIRSDCLVGHEERTSQLYLKMLSNEFGNFFLAKSFVNKIILYSYKSFIFNIFDLFEKRIRMTIVLNVIYESQSTFL